MAEERAVLLSRGIEEKEISKGGGGGGTMKQFREQFYNSVRGENSSQTKANSNIQTFDCDNYGRFTVEKISKASFD